MIHDWVFMSPSDWLSGYESLYPFPFPNFELKSVSWREHSFIPGSTIHDVVGEIITGSL
jgi:hypothetical protein